ncbi:hypothetical protein HAX54_033884, partial [Datura stramonium]|nr:hypothetical protein [Datura stramonium]
SLLAISGEIHVVATTSPSPATTYKIRHISPSSFLPSQAEQHHQATETPPKKNRAFLLYRFLPENEPATTDRPHPLPLILFIQNSRCITLPPLCLHYSNEDNDVDYRSTRTTSLLLSKHIATLLLGQFPTNHHTYTTIFEDSSTDLHE